MSHPAPRRSLLALLAALALVLPPSLASAAPADGPAPQTEAAPTATTSPAVDAPAPDADPAPEEAPDDAPEPAPAPAPVEGTAVPAAPGDPVTTQLVSRDGRAPFDTSAGPGLDTAETNGIVRANDTITYAVGIVIGAEDAESAVVTLSLPAGVQMTSLPAQCRAETSSLAPAARTSTTWDLTPATLAPQTLTCDLAGPFRAGTTTVVDFEARVLPGDWTSSPTITATATTLVRTADGESTSTPTRITDQVTQAPKYDVQVMNAQDGAGYMQWEGRYSSCLQPGPAGMTYNQTCLNLRVPVQISVPDGGRGSIPLDPSVPFVYRFDLTLDTLFGAGTSAMIQAATGLSADEVDRRYGARLATWSVDNPHDVPRTRLGVAGSTTTNSVRDSGTTTCTHEGAAAQANPATYGKVLTMSVTGMDTTAFTAPTVTGTNMPIQPQDQYGTPLHDYVHSRAHAISVPTETLALVEQGTVQPGSGQFSITTRAVASTPTVGEDPENDTHTDVMTFQNTQTVVGTFTGSPAEAGTSRVTEPRVFSQGNAAWYGPAGPSTFGGGDGVLFPDQTTYATSVVNQTLIPGASTYSSLVCQAIDTDHVRLVDPEWTDSSLHQQALAPTEQGNTGPAFVSGMLWNFSTVGLPGSTWTLDQVMPQRRIQYGVAGTAGSTDLADCSGTTWYDTAEEAAAAGGDTTPGDGAYDGVTHVRFWTVTTPNDPTTGAFRSANITMSLAVPVALRDPASSGGMRVGTWSAQTSAAGTHDVDDLLALATSGAAPWVTSDYDKATDAGVRGDRVTVTSTLVGLRKQISVPQPDGTAALYGPSETWDVAAQTWQPPLTAQVPRLAAGTRFSYVLTPDLPDTGQGQSFTSMRIEECLPANVQLQGATYRGAEIDPLDAANEVTELECDTDNPDPVLRETHVLFDVPGTFTEGTTAEPLVLDVRVRNTAPSVSATEGVPGLRGGLVNEAVVSFPGVTTETHVRTSATRLYVDASRQFGTTKAAVDPFVATNPQGWAIEDRLPRWDLLVVNPDSVPATEVDVVDVLPRQGDPADLPTQSEYTGSYAVLAPEVVDGAPTNLRVLYTTDPAMTLDPTVPTVTWCTPGADGTWEVVTGDGSDPCPTTRTDPRTGTPLHDGVTGVRFLADSMAARSTFHAIVSIVPEDNTAGDVYVNQSAGTMSGFELAPSRQATVHVVEDVPAAEVAKSVVVTRDGEPVTGAALPGDTVTWTLEVLNAGQADFTAENPAIVVDSLAGALDDVELVDVSASTGTARRVGDQIHWSAPLAAGDTATVTYSGTARAGGDGVAANLAFTWPPDDDGDPTTPPPGAPALPDGPVTQLPETCTEPTCASTSTPVTNVAVTKEVTGATGEGGVALPGDVLTWTVRVTNTSTVDRPADDPIVVTDSLAQVLDDGTLLEGWAADRGDLTWEEPELHWTGALEAGATATLTYRVETTEGGDGHAPNVAVAAPFGETGGFPAPDPSGCAAPTCARTDTEVSTLVIDKTVSGATGPDGAARVDDVLTYTVTATNIGGVDRTVEDPVRVVDLWSTVLDDADLDATGPQASDGSVVRRDDVLVWETPLVAGGEATLTYRVTVTGEGDGDVRNVAVHHAEPVPPGTPVDVPPADCTGPRCAATRTPVEEPPAVTPGPGTPTGTPPAAEQDGPRPGPLAVTGASGVGLLALLAQAAVIAGRGLRRRTS